MVRTTAEHLLNKKSNRSHCLFTMHFQQKSRLGIDVKIRHSKLQLVDLAGSERLKKTMSASHDAAIKKESMYINKSLTYLEQCVVALTSRDRGFVPYRQTKLTHVLKDSLGGNCRTLLIACIWGGNYCTDTLAILKLLQPVSFSISFILSYIHMPLLFSYDLL